MHPSLLLRPLQPCLYPPSVGRDPAATLSARCPTLLPSSFVCVALSSSRFHSLLAKFSVCFHATLSNDGRDQRSAPQAS